MMKLDTKIGKYYLIDKVIINKDTQFSFDLYTKKKEEESLELIFDKEQIINENDLKKIISFRSVYVYEEEKELYEKYYSSFMKQKILPKDMKDFYLNIGNSVNKMFENPEALANMKEVQGIVSDLVSTILEDNFTVNSFITILSSDYYTHTHSLNVSVYAICLGKNIGIGKKELEKLGTSALLHDLGKSKIRSEIINKNGKLTEHEFNEIKKHPTYGWALARKLGITNKGILSGIRNHHEKLDGTGYPDKQKKDQIHIFAKIIAICDVFDALTTKRSYKDSLRTFNTLIMMKKEMSQHLDNTIVNHFIRIFTEEEKEKESVQHFISA